MHVVGVEQLERMARAYALELKPEAQAVVVTLSGDLGSGKTTFAQAVLRALGVTEHITSPTFVIQKSYDLRGQVFRRAIHIDAYRLTSSHELAVLGWNELKSDPQTLILLEWPEKVLELIPKTARRVTLNYIDETTRDIDL